MTIPAPAPAPADVALDLAEKLANLTGVTVPAHLLEFRDVMAADQLAAILAEIQNIADRIERLARAMVQAADSVTYPTPARRTRAIIRWAERLFLQRDRLALYRSELLNLLEAQYVPKEYLAPLYA